MIIFSILCFLFALASFTLMIVFNVLLFKSRHQRHPGEALKAPWSIIFHTVDCLSLTWFFGFVYYSYIEGISTRNFAFTIFFALLTGLSLGMHLLYTTNRKKEGKSSEECVPWHLLLFYGDAVTVLWFASFLTDAMKVGASFLSTLGCIEFALLLIFCFGAHVYYTMKSPKEKTADETSYSE